MCKMNTHTHNARTHARTLYRLIGVKDNVAEPKYSEKRNVLSLLIAELMKRGK